MDRHYSGSLLGWLRAIGEPLEEGTTARVPGLDAPPYFGDAAAQQRDRRSAQRGAATGRRSAHRNHGEHVTQVEPNVAGEAVDLRSDVQVSVRGLGLG